MILKLSNIHKTYGIQKVLEGLNFEVEANQSVAITGPSGTGKTTFLNLIAALDKPDSGTVTFSDKDLSAMNRMQLAEFRNRNIGFIFQMHYLLPQCTVIENVLLPTIELTSKAEKKKAEERAYYLLQRVGMEQHIQKHPAQLSGGECQRTAFVRALINQPSLILADEPTGSLDPEMASILSGLLIDLNREQHTTLIVVTHSLELAAKMDIVYQLKNHQLVKI